MTTTRIKNITTTLSFFSITIGWTFTNLLYSIYLGWTYGKATDSGVVLFCSGLFIYVAWAIFITYPLAKLDHTKKIFKPNTFPFLTSGYAGLVYTILVGGLFRDIDIVLIFMPLAAIIGLIFGFTYSTMIANERIITLLNNKPLYRLTLFLSPVFILTFFLVLLPRLFPYTIHRFMPDETQDKIFAETIVTFKVGDSYKELQKIFPDEFKSEGTFSSTYSGPHLDFLMEVRNDTIVRLEFKSTEKH